IGSTITAAPTPIRLVMDAAKVKATTGSRQVPSSTVFSVTQSSRKPNSSARRATVSTVVRANGSGERCGNDMPRAVLSRNVMVFYLVRFIHQLDRACMSFLIADRQSSMCGKREKCGRAVVITAGPRCRWVREPRLAASILGVVGRSAEARCRPPANGEEIFWRTENGLPTAWNPPHPGRRGARTHQCRQITGNGRARRPCSSTTQGPSRSCALGHLDDCGLGALQVEGTGDPAN